MRHWRLIGLSTVLLLVAAACSGGSTPESTTTTTPPATAAPPATAPPTTPAPTTTAAPESDDMRTLDAVLAEITVDGDGSEWADIVGLDLTLEPIEGKTFETKAATVKVAHDGEYFYMLFTVDDDFDWVVDDAHLSASSAVMWAIDAAAGAHMGTDTLDGEGPSLGMVDIWHWELQCGPGVEAGGSVSGPGDKDPGNDAGCNFDDEYATDPETREDDGGTGAENSLFGVYRHTSETNGDSGTWTFEMRRPLTTGDEQDVQFSVGGTALLSLAYWDADNSIEGWDDADHVQTSNQGWIKVILLAS